MWGLDLNLPPPRGFATKLRYFEIIFVSNNKKNISRYLFASMDIFFLAKFVPGYRRYRPTGLETPDAKSVPPCFGRSSAACPVKTMSAASAPEGRPNGFWWLYKHRNRRPWRFPIPCNTLCLRNDVGSLQQTAVTVLWWSSRCGGNPNFPCRI